MLLHLNTNDFLLFSIFWDLELDLAFVAELTQFTECLLILATVEEAAYFFDSVLHINWLFHWTNSHWSVYLLRGSILELLDVFEVDYGRKAALIICLHLHSHNILHVHELVRHHTVLELCVLWILCTILRIEVHVRVHVDTLSRETHLVLHHHSWELHILHAHTVHSHRAWLHLIISHLATHCSSTCWILLTRSKICVTMGIRAFISIFTYTTYVIKKS